MQHIDFQLKGTIGILLVPSTDDIAFLLVVLFLMIVRQGTIVIAFLPVLSIILIIWLLIVLLLQLSFQLMVPLSEPFIRCSKSLNLPF